MLDTSMLKRYKPKLTDNHRTRLANDKERYIDRMAIYFLATQLRMHQSRNDLEGYIFIPKNSLFVSKRIY